MVVSSLACVCATSSPSLRSSSPAPHPRCLARVSLRTVFLVVTRHPLCATRTSESGGRHGRPETTQHLSLPR
eukprot:7150246-Prymnesium_polylepis.1